MVRRQNRLGSGTGQPRCAPSTCVSGVLRQTMLHHSLRALLVAGKSSTHTDQGTGLRETVIGYGLKKKKWLPVSDFT